ncbi:hypothetical protein BGZ52_003913, partial [Haplosporangium bisporale]
MAKMLVHYCLARAQSDNPVFFEMLMVSLPHIIPQHPELALDVARRVAFLSELNLEDVHHKSIHNGIQWRPRFWETAKSNLYELMDQNPVFHLLDKLPVKKRGDSGLWLAKVLRLLWHFVNPIDTIYIQSNYSTLETFDNPAIMAVMTYKWTRFARYFWCVRLLFQFAYESLVLGITVVQLFGNVDRRANMQPGYIAVIILGYMLLHLEFQQMRGGIRRYFSSPYNYVDLGAYTIPMIASGLLIADHESADAQRALSFAVVLIYLHFIFELRVFKSVCKVVTIVVNILLEIPAFFAIMAIFILSFAHSINHLTEVNFRAVDCQLDPADAMSPSVCNTKRSEFPTNYFQSVSATYFFMTGNYSPVATSLMNGHWTSQLMVGLFFFLTAMLMMNVVIALMNGVYSDAVIAAEQTWLRNRIELVASAENLTYFLPFFRDRFDYFPKYIYYTATENQVAEYKKTYGFDENPLQFRFSPVRDRQKDLMEALKLKVEVEQERRTLAARAKNIATAAAKHSSPGKNRMDKDSAVEIQAKAEEDRTIQVMLAKIRQDLVQDQIDHRTELLNQLATIRKEKQESDRKLTELLTQTDRQIKAMMDTIISLSKTQQTE